MSLSPGLVSGLIVALITQSLALIFYGGVLFQTVRDHARRLDDVEPKLNDLQIEFAAHKGKEEA